MNCSSGKEDVGRKDELIGSEKKREREQVQQSSDQEFIAPDCPNE